MAAKNSIKAATKDYLGEEFIIKREYDAPRKLVFKAWTEPGHLVHWWGPKGFTNPVCEWNAVPGKKILVVMRAPNGSDYPMGGEFREVVAPGKLVFTSGAQDAKGKLLFELLHTVTFEERNGRTSLTIHSRVTKTTPGAGKYIGGFEAGMTQSLARLEGLLAGKCGPLLVERILNAPVSKVWEAISTREANAEWLFDFKGFRPEAGCVFTFEVRHKGFHYRHKCKVVKVVPEKRLAYTWRFAGFAGDSLVTFELFAAGGGKTRVLVTHSGLDTFPKQPEFAPENFYGGWTSLIGESLKQFVETNTTGREILISRVVDAPRELVWDAMTDPKQVIHWWGPRGFSTTIKKMDVRPGGVWEHVMLGPDGAKYPNKSIFREVVKPERIVYSHGGHREGGPGIRFVSTWTFEKAPKGKTKVTIHMVFPTAAKRDFVVREFGAVEGGKQTLARLDEYLAKGWDAK